MVQSLEAHALMMPWQPGWEAAAEAGWVGAHWVGLGVAAAYLLAAGGS